MATLILIETTVKKLLSEKIDIDERVKELIENFDDDFTHCVYWEYASEYNRGRLHYLSEKHFWDTVKEHYSPKELYEYIVVRPDDELYIEMVDDDTVAVYVSMDIDYDFYEAIEENYQNDYH